MNLNELTGGVLYGIPQPWLGVFGLVLLGVLIFALNQLVQRIVKRLRARRDAADAVWSSALLDAVGPPLHALLWLLGALFALEFLLHRFVTESGGVQFLSARSVLVTVVAAWFLFRLAYRLEQNLHARGARQGIPLDPTAASAVGKLARVVILIIALLAIMQTLEFSIAGLLAFGGAAGIAVGFAAQSLVANLLGGLTIFATRIFNIGETIIIPETELAGTVEHIGWRATRVLGRDHKPFYIPNAVFNTTTIINHTRMRDRRIREHVHLCYEDIDKVPAIVEEGNRMLAEHPEMDKDFQVLRFDAYGESALRLLIYGYVATTSYTEYMQVKEDVLLKLAGIVRRHGAELAVPASRVYLPQAPGERDGEALLDQS